MEAKEDKSVDKRVPYLLKKMENPGDFSLPQANHENLQLILRMNAFPPRLIYSNYGRNKAGKSSFMNLTRSNPFFNRENMKMKMFQEGANGLTYYDSFYYSQKTEKPKKKFEEAHQIEASELLIKIQTKYPPQSYFCHKDSIQMQTVERKQLVEIHKKGRDNMINLKKTDQADFVEKRTILMEKRFMTYKSHLGIFQDEKMCFMNEYSTLLDRAGYDDSCLSLGYGVDPHQVIRELLRVNNETIFYCLNTSNSTDNGSLNQDLLSLLNNHSLDKITICFNFYYSLTEYKQNTETKKKIKEFLQAIMKIIPQNLIIMFNEKIKLIKNSYLLKEEKIVQKVKNEVKSYIGKQFQMDEDSEKQKKFFQDKIKSLEYFIMIYENQKKLIQSYSGPQDKEEDQFDEDTSFHNDYEQRLLELAGKFNEYPFEFIHFYGLDNYAQKVDIIKIIKTKSEEKLKTKLITDFKKNFTEMKSYQCKLAESILMESLKFKELIFNKKQIIGSLCKVINQKTKDRIVDKIKTIVLRILDLLESCQIQIEHAVNTIIEQKDKSELNQQFSTYLKESVENLFKKNKDIIEGQIQETSKIFCELVLEIKQDIQSASKSNNNTNLEDLIKMITDEMVQKQQRVLRFIEEKWNQLINFIRDHCKLMNLDVKLDCLNLKQMFFKTLQQYGPLVTLIGALFLPQILAANAVWGAITFTINKLNYQNFNKQFLEKHRYKLVGFKWETKKKCQSLMKSLSDDGFKEEIHSLANLMENIKYKEVTIDKEEESNHLISFLNDYIKKNKDEMERVDNLIKL